MFVRPPSARGSYLSSRLLLETLEDRAVPSATLVKDVNPASVGSVFPDLSGSGDSVRLGNRLYFAAFDGTSTAQLWSSDGSTEGTVLVKDLGTGGSLHNFTAGGNFFYFSMSDSSQGNTLWKSDGTAAGTVLVTDFAGTAGPVVILQNFAVVDSLLYFTASDPVHGVELWKSDGTVAGTGLVKDIHPGNEDSFPGSLTAVGNHLYFSADDGSHGFELWQTDGTAAGTVLVADLATGTVDGAPAGSYPSNLTAVGNTLYFTATDNTHGTEIWVTNGTTSGTRGVADLVLGKDGSSPQELTPFQGKLFFTASDKAGRLSLYSTDGTTSGTTPIAPLGLATQGGAVLSVAKGMLNILCDDGDLRKLWVSNGTSSGTRAVKEFDAAGPFPVILDTVNDQVFFTATQGATNPAIWTSDGTSTGTQALLPLMLNSPVGGGVPSFYGGINGQVVFAADDGARGPQLWRTDGTPSGTSVLKVINPTTQSGAPQNLTQFQGAVYFLATDLSGGPQLWRTDGTTGGTTLIKAIGPNAGSLSYLDPQVPMVVVGAKLYFVIDDGIHGTELWVSNGTSEGTNLVEDLFPGPNGSQPTSLVAFGNTLFFAASDGVHGVELWKSEGTASTTNLVEDLYPGEVAINKGLAQSIPLSSATTPANSSFPRHLVAMGNAVYFTATDGTSGAQLWKSDGTTGGTTLVRDLAPGSPTFGVIHLDSLTAVESRLFFTSLSSDGAPQLWVSDGTRVGTTRVKEFGTGTDAWMPIELTGVGSTLFFSSGTPETGRELWKSDGTIQGTMLVKDLLTPTPEEGSSPEDSPSGSPQALTAISGKLYFVAVSPDRVHWALYTSDGSSEGTTVVDILPTVVSAGAMDPPQIVATEGAFFLNTVDGQGREILWRADGTEAGSGPLLNSSGPRNVQNLSVLGSTLVFSGSDSLHGQEIWKLNAKTARPVGEGPDVPPPPPSPGDDGSQPFPVPTRAENETWLRRAYRDLLGRPADEGGMNYWAGLMERGLSRTGVVLGIESSVEYDSRVVESLYRLHLKREADANGLNFFVNLMQQGDGAEEVRGAILSSPEYLRKRAIATDEAFIDTISQDTLGRSLEETARVGYMGILSATRSRHEIAHAFLAGSEFRQRTVASAYEQFLQRTADGGGLAYFAEVLAGPSREEDLIAALLGSEEYFRKS